MSSGVGGERLMDHVGQTCSVVEHLRGHSRTDLVFVRERNEGSVFGSERRVQCFRSL